jgi:hypothetical protein
VAWVDFLAAFRGHVCLVFGGEREDTF